MTAPAVLAIAAGLAVAGALTLAARRRRHELVRRLGGAAQALGGALPAPAGDLPAAIGALEAAIATAAGREAAAREASARMERALDVIPQGVVIVDDEGEIAFDNEVAAEFLTARHGERLVEEAIVELCKGAVVGTAATRTVELFGPPRRTLVLRSLPLEQDRRLVGALVVIEDVSERRRVDAMRRDFVANISHELKTPIGALGLLAETLLAEEDAGVRRRLAERLISEAFRVAQVIDDLLELSRIEVGEEGTRLPVPVHSCVAEAVDRARPLAEQRGVELLVDEPDQGALVLGDERQLVSAVYNLVENAVKYSDAGSAVHVAAHRRGDSLDIEVEDHGIGIPQRDLERVFERFYRVDRGRSRETGGTGLGLAIVRHVATNHRGEIRVDSREGEGSTFTLHLPAAGASPAAEVV